MSLIIRFPDGNIEKIPFSEVPDLSHIVDENIQIEANIIEGEDGYKISLATNAANDIFINWEPIETYTIELTKAEEMGNVPAIRLWQLGESNPIESTPILTAGVSGSMVDRWKRPGPCNLIMMIGEAWEAGRIVNGAIDGSQQSDDMFRGFDEDGRPILDSSIQMGHVLDPTAKLIFLDVIRRLLVWKVPFCKFRSPPDKPVDEPKTVVDKPEPEHVPETDAKRVSVDDNDLEWYWYPVIFVAALGLAVAFVFTGGGGLGLEPAPASFGGTIYYGPNGEPYSFPDPA